MSSKYVSAWDFIAKEASNEELNMLVEAMKHRRNTLSKVAKMKIGAGSLVEFVHRGITYKGKVTAVKTKKATVACTHPVVTTYQVPLNMLAGV